MSQTLANISITEEVGETVDDNNATVSSGTRGKQKSYEFDCIYDTIEKAEAVLKLEKIWSKTKPHDITNMSLIGHFTGLLLSIKKSVFKTINNTISLIINLLETLKFL
jgi:hypothetical protein